MAHSCHFPPSQQQINPSTCSGQNPEYSPDSSFFSPGIQIHEQVLCSDSQIHPQTLQASWSTRPPQQTPASGKPVLTWVLVKWEATVGPNKSLPKSSPPPSPTYPSFPFYLLIAGGREYGLLCHLRTQGVLYQVLCMINRLSPPWSTYFQAEVLSTKVWQKNIVKKLINRNLSSI